MRPTLSAAALVACGILASLATNLLAPDYWLFPAIYVGIVLLMVGADAANAIPRRDVNLTSTVPSSIFVGEESQIELRVSLTAPRSPTMAGVRLDVDGCLEPVAPDQTMFVPGASSTAVFSLHPTRRGQGRIKTVWYHWKGPFRLIRLVRRMELNKTINVVPNIRSVQQQAISFANDDSLTGQKKATRLGDGSEFASLRDWITGLDHRAIDWKHSARHRKLVCKEFQAERNQQIILAFDTGHLMSEVVEGAPRLDHAISAGLLLAYTSLKIGDRVGLFAFDSGVRQILGPDSGSRQFELLRQMTSAFDYSTHETNFTLALMDLIGRLNQRSLIVIQSEFVDTVTAELMVENLTRLVNRHLIIFATQSDPGLLDHTGREPSSFGGITRAVLAADILKERQITLERLRRIGVHCIDVPARQLNGELLDKYIDIKRLELI